MTNKKSVREQLSDWARDAIKDLNPLALKTGIGYYQQSPLNGINNPIETLVCGINPGSGSSGRELSAETFLNGNDDWTSRFISEDDNAYVSKKWAKYFGDAHYFICNDKVRHRDGFDNDTKTVWTNLTPFATPDSNGLTKELYTASIPYTLKLFQILKPKRIILLGFDSFDKIMKYHGDVNIKVIAIPIVKDRLEKGLLIVGTIDGIPTIQLPHPSRSWNFHRFFVPLFVQMWDQIVKERRPLIETAEKIKNNLTRLEPVSMQRHVPPSH